MRDFIAGSATRSGLSVYDGFAAFKELEHWIECGDHTVGQYNYMDLIAGSSNQCGSELVARCIRNGIQMVFFTTMTQKFALLHIGQGKPYAIYSHSTLV
jgi:hypothetical protein